MTNVLKQGETVARNVTFATLVLALLKLGAGLVTSSVAILADALHSFSDLIPIIAAWAGLKISQKPKSNEFPYGYYKAENLAALFASLFIFLLGFEVLKESVSRLFVLTTVHNDIVGFGVTIVAMFVSYILYNYQLSAARETNSQALMANAMETRMDVISSGLVFVGFAASVFSVPYVEGLVGILLSLFIFHAGYESARDAVLALMDAGVSDDKVKEIENAIKSVPRVKSVRNLYARRSGPFVMVEATVTVPIGLDINQAHMVASQVEEKLKSLKSVDHAVVHVEPEKKSLLVARPVNEDGTISKVFGSAPYFEIYHVSGDHRKLFEKVRNPGAKLKKKRGVKAALFLIDKGIDAVEVVNIGDDSKEILENAGVDVVNVNA